MHSRYVTTTSKSSDRAATLLLQMADLERGERIRSLRIAHPEYGQKHLAAAAGVTIRAYQAWEAGGGIKIENAKALAKFLKVDWRWIVHGDTQPTPDVIGALGSRDETALREQLDRHEKKLDLIIDYFDIKANDQGRATTRFAAAFRAARRAAPAKRLGTPSPKKKTQEGP